MAARRDESLASVLVALAANSAIALAKGVAAALTGSPALLAETLHTVADAGNEVLLWIALRRSRRPPDPSHPLGYGPERYYWALLAAIGMFVIGGALSIWEGIHALIDPTVVTVYLEDSIDVLGAGLALVALVLHRVTGSAVPDAIATIVIGFLLGYVALKLTSRNRQLLANQGVPERYVARMRERLGAVDGVESVARLEAVYLGPGEVLVAADVVMERGLDGDELVAVLARIRSTAAREVPEIARLYITPV